MQTEIDKLVLEIAAAYNELGYTHSEAWSPENIIVKRSKVYTKIITNNNSVWGFIANDDNPKKGYLKGDILKAASWSAPAKHARGNLFTGYAAVQWTGPCYMGTDKQAENEQLKAKADFNANEIEGMAQL